MNDFPLPPNHLPYLFIRRRSYTRSRSSGAFGKCVFRKITRVTCCTRVHNSPAQPFPGKPVPSYCGASDVLPLRRAHSQRGPRVSPLAFALASFARPSKSDGIGCDRRFVPDEITLSRCTLRTGLFEYEYEYFLFS